MRQYTNKEQTQHLIELGFPEPKIIANTEFEELPSGLTHLFTRYDYSIGELIGFLGNRLMGITFVKTYDVYAYKKTNDIEYVDWFNTKGELIDALYDACIELKKEGAI